MGKVLMVVFALIQITVFCQPRVITFDSDKGENKNKIEKNVLKLSLIELASGDFPIYYERTFGKKLSVEGGVGLTYGDYFGSFFNADHHSLLSEDIELKFGHSLALALRFYPVEVLDEFYIALEYKYRKYQWERLAYLNEETSFEQATFLESRINSMPRISLGYTFFMNSNFIFDSFAGIGVNIIKEDFYSSELAKREEKEKIRPRLHLGFKIGYAF